MSTKTQRCTYRDCTANTRRCRADQ